MPRAWKSWRYDKNDPGLCKNVARMTAPGSLRLVVTFRSKKTQKFVFARNNDQIQFSFSQSQDLTEISGIFCGCTAPSVQYVHRLRGRIRGQLMRRRDLSRSAAGARAWPLARAHSSRECRWFGFGPQAKCRHLRGSFCAAFAKGSGHGSRGRKQCGWNTFSEGQPDRLRVMVLFDSRAGAVIVGITVAASAAKRNHAIPSSSTQAALVEAGLVASLKPARRQKVTGVSCSATCWGKATGAARKLVHQARQSPCGEPSTEGGGGGGGGGLGGGMGGLPKPERRDVEATAEHRAATYYMIDAAATAIRDALQRLLNDGLVRGS